MATTNVLNVSSFHVQTLYLNVVCLVSKAHRATYYCDDIIIRFVPNFSYPFHIMYKMIVNPVVLLASFLRGSLPPYMLHSLKTCSIHFSLLFSIISLIFSSPVL